MKVLKLFLQILIFIGLKIKELFWNRIIKECFVVIGIILLIITVFLLLIFIFGFVWYITPQEFWVNLSSDILSKTFFIRQMEIGFYIFGGLFFSFLVLMSFIGGFLKIKENYNFNDIIKFFKSNWKQSENIVNKIIKR
jgi:hypothetical protein